MENIKITLPDAVEGALKRLFDAGYDAFAVGGCVRDALLGRLPNDWDITTAARPEQTAEVFFDCRTVQTGVKHGTLTVLFGGEALEITTFRNDGEYADNRHPISVTFSDTVEEDLSRRDFTVNAMAYAPQRGLVDLFGGREDLRRRVIRCVGEPARRFSEDGLRILRAIRFASVLDFEIDPETADAIHKMSYLLQGIAAERIREELCKLVCGRGAVRILREYSDVIAQILPELGACVGFAQNSRYHCFDVYEHSIEALSYNTGEDLITRLSILLHDVGKPLSYTEDAEGGHFKGHAAAGVALCQGLISRLRFDNDTALRVIRLVEWHDRPVPAEPRAVKRLMRMFSDEDILRLLEIKRCDRLAHAEEYRALPADLQEIPRVMQEIRDANACLSLRTMQLRGDDLISMGVPPGKRIGVILERLLDEVLDGTLPNEHEALCAAAQKMIEKTKRTDEGSC